MSPSSTPGCGTVATCTATPAPPAPAPAPPAAPPADEEARRHRGRLDREIERARYDLRGAGQLAFFVPAREGHDDYLMSLALCAWAAAASPPPPVSETIPPAIDRHGRVQGEQDGDAGYGGAGRFARRWDEVY